MKHTERYFLIIIFLLLSTACSDNATNTPQNSTRAIKTFSIGEGQIGEAQIIGDPDSSRVIVKAEEGTDLSAVTPAIEISAGATIEPASGEPVDFSANDNRYTYTVTAESGAEQQWYVEIIETVREAAFIILPDTQSYSEGTANRPYFTSQIDWILDNKEDISLVIHLGDLTNRNIPGQWEFIESEVSRLNNEVPYVLAVGNHDMGPSGDASDRNTTYFNQYFPYSTMSELPAFGGIYPDPAGSDKMDNAYYLLETGQYKWLVLSLEFGPRDAVLEWANDIVSQYPDRTVIIDTHAYMFSDDTRYGPGDTWNPHDYGIDDLGPNEVNDGEEMWAKLVKGNSNIRFVFSGHVLNDGVGTLISTNDAGEQVYQLLSNFQSGVDGSENGGNGYLRRITMDFVNDKLKVETFSSYPGVGVHPNEEHNFEISPLDLN